MSVSVDRIRGISNQLFDILNQVDPRIGAVVHGADVVLKLFDIGKELNGLLKEIASQTDANSDEVMRKVIQDYKNSTSELRQAISDRLNEQH